MIYLFSHEATAAPTDGIELTYTGCRASELEPCGCHANQQGGVQFEATLYQQQATSATLRLDAGGWVGTDPLAKSLTAMKSRFLLRAMASIGLDAVNFGCSEATLSRFYFSQLQKESPEAFSLLVSANVFLTTAPATLAFADTRVLTRTLSGGRSVRIAVTGVTVPSTSQSARLVQTSASTLPGDFLIKPMIPCLEPVVARLRSEADLLIVLVHGTAQDCLPLARAFPQVDLFIASTPEDPLNKRSLPPESARRILAASSTKGRQIGRVRLTPDAANRWTVAGGPENIPVSDKLPATPELVQLIEEYKLATRQFQELPRPDVKQIYAGSSSCRRCHAREYKDWLSSRHAHALETLTNRNQQFNQECLPCHTLGFRQENGFYSVTLPTSDVMGNVQCENCHGPARLHAQKQMGLDNSPLRRLNPTVFAKLEKDAKLALPQKEVPAATCQKCHEPEHDDKFDYQAKLFKVSHRDITPTPHETGAHQFYDDARPMQGRQ